MNKENCALKLVDEIIQNDELIKEAGSRMNSGKYPDEYGLSS